MAANPSLMFRFEITRVWAHRFEIRNTFAHLPARLRAEKSFLLENETRAYQNATGDCQDHPDDLYALCKVRVSLGQRVRLRPRTLRFVPADSVFVTADDVAANTDDVGVADRDDIGGRTTPVV